MFQLVHMLALFNYINRYASISEKDFNVFQNHFSEKKVRKKQYLLEEGEICKYFAFIVKGAMRKYYIDEKVIKNQNIY